MKSIMEEASSIMEAIQKGWDRAGKPHEFSVKVFEDAQTSFFGMRTVKSAKIALFYKEGAPSFTTEKADSSTRSAKNRQQDRSFDHSRTSHSTSSARTSSAQPAQAGHDRRSPRAHDRTEQLEKRQQRNERAQKPHRPLENLGAGNSEQAERAERPAPAQQKLREARPLADSSQLPADAQTASRGGVWNDEMISWVNTWVRQTLAHAGHTNIDFSTESSRNLLRIDFSAPITGDEKQERILFSSFAHLIMSSLRNKFKGDLKHLKVVLNSR